MRAAHPTTTGHAERANAAIAYAVYGEDDRAPTVLLLPTWSIIHSRHWKMVLPYLALHYRVVTYDGLGNGASDRVLDPARYGGHHMIEDCLAVLDATNTASALCAGVSQGGALALMMGALHPERVDGIVSIAPPHPWMADGDLARQANGPMYEPVTDDATGWETYNVHYWRQDWAGFVDFFMNECCSDPHSTKLFDDTLAWAAETNGDVIAAEATGGGPPLDLERVVEGLGHMPMPVRIVHGTDDRIQPYASSLALLEHVPGAELITLDGAGHLPNARFPVKINHIIKNLADAVYERPAPAPSARRSKGSAEKRVLMISSPIGLGHSRRDIAICEELRRLHPGIEVDWLAQDPVTRVLAGAGETIHPASALLANESAHIESEAGEHDLAVFQALRDMDEILVANFMICDEVLAQGNYDLVVGDESWELDYHLHENPNLKKANYAWLTDFVGFLPMPDQGEREAFVAADYNAEMIMHIATRGVRDRSIFVGNPDDIVPDTFGPDLPAIRSWTEDNYDFAGYVTGFDPAALPERDELRTELGYRLDQSLCVVTVGGSGVGSDLLRRVAAAAPAARDRVPGLRFIVVTGPRIDPSTLPEVEGVEYRSYVDRLYRHLACADVAIVQGGLTTTMELTALAVPFIYVPLRNHFEQNFHVRARLDNYNAGHYLDYDDVQPDRVAEVIASLINHPPTPRPVETNGAAHAATLIADLL